MLDDERSEAIQKRAKVDEKKKRKKIYLHEHKYIHTNYVHRTAKEKGVEREKNEEGEKKKERKKNIREK